MNLTRARTAYHWDHAVFTFFLVPVSSVLQVTHRLQRNRENERRLRRAWTLVPWVGWGKGEGRGWKRGVWGGIFLRYCICFREPLFPPGVVDQFWITWDELSLALLDEYLVSTFFHGLLFTVIDYHVCVHKVHESCWWFPKLNNAMKSCY